ncbi:uracil phosphoribosyltransferase-domain-containing protein [Lasiosphaeria ovina]|uniref:Uracil phosphoribosyltransferase-domain-containing protein n=1 Tax=Lasiosphaeria ovina TaxID=92902 RepID=A0AAE0N7G0_9PEZI|nr:uracil phosphoribosyltransferase-domain-containing protein [Lasiosphaeria ovina]
MAAAPKPTVVGIYGIPGCGKTHLLTQLKSRLGETRFAFFEGSSVIGNLVPGGLEAFQECGPDEQQRWRALAIYAIAKECATNQRAGIVAGHFSFWPDDAAEPNVVCACADLATFTHLVYLDVDADVVARRRHDDTQRTRPAMPTSHLQKWQRADIRALRALCRSHGILSVILSVTDESTPLLLDRACALLADFQMHTSQANLALAEKRVDEIVAASSIACNPATAVVLDADKTLAAEDAGEVFWDMMATRRSLQQTEDKSPLKTLFSGPQGYSYMAFRQAMLLYEEAADDGEFDAVCRAVVARVTVHPEMAALVRRAAGQGHVVTLVVTCGLRRVWDMVLAREGLSERVQVVGGGRLSDGFVVTPEVKAAVVTRLHNYHHMYVWTFGDSVLDLPMLNAAHQAVVVVGQEHTRSKSMDAALSSAIDSSGLRARQALLPATASPRLDTDRLPVVDITSEQFIGDVLDHGPDRLAAIIQSRLVHATERSSARLLMSPTRDARVAGPALRDAHRRVGWYLATEFVSDVVGLEEHSIPHVQGHQTQGHRLRGESATSIVALMRGGEPMALGVNDAFPTAMFIHATKPADIKRHHVLEGGTVMLVDSVVNTGKSVLEFVRHIRITLGTNIPIVMVAGVVQSQSVGQEGTLGRALERDTGLTVVALRLSENKFSGVGGTDTGNRLFNTTHVN